MDITHLIYTHIKPIGITIGAITLTSIDEIDSYLKGMLLAASFVYVCIQAYYYIKNKGKFKE
jgi:hypothetical protein